MENVVKNSGSGVLECGYEFLEKLFRSKRTNELTIRVLSDYTYMSVESMNTKICDEDKGIHFMQLMNTDLRAGMLKIKSINGKLYLVVPSNTVWTLRQVERDVIVEDVKLSAYVYNLVGDNHSMLDVNLENLHFEI